MPPSCWLPVFTDMRCRLSRTRCWCNSTAWHCLVLHAIAMRTRHGANVHLLVSVSNAVANNAQAGGTPQLYMDVSHSTPSLRPDCSRAQARHGPVRAACWRMACLLAGSARHYQRTAQTSRKPLVKAARCMFGASPGRLGLAFGAGLPSTPMGGWAGSDDWAMTSGNLLLPRPPNAFGAKIIQYP